MSDHRTAGLVFQEDTIVALATPVGVSALAVIRLSGKQVRSIVSQVWKGADLEKLPSHSVRYGWLHDADGLPLDEVMLTWMQGPKTFTTEDSIEITCHGNPHVIKSVLQALVAAGARMATAGEFTRRAFVKGRLDLSQAEAVADLIHAESDAARKAALSQMRGGLRRQLQALRQELIDFAALLELELDFSEEDVEFARRQELLALIDKITTLLTPLADSFRMGNAIKKGIPVVIIGKPNAGKSTLLNALLQEEKAIVSPIAGTTRDSIEDELELGGILFRFIDTAGLRQSDDLIEQIGVSRAKDHLRKAQVVLYLADCTDFDREQLPIVLEELALTSEQTLVLLANKADQITLDECASWQDEGWLPIVAQDPDTLAPLKERLLHFVQLPDFGSDQTLITSERHHSELLATLKALHQAREGLLHAALTEMLAADLRDALHHLGSITGAISNEELLGSIFGRFCIGK